MKMQRIYEVGEQVMIQVKIISVSFDDHGRIKYKLKDEKSSRILDWEYTEDEITPCRQTKAVSKTKSKAVTNSTSTAKTTKTKRIKNNT